MHVRHRPGDEAPDALAQSFQQSRVEMTKNEMAIIDDNSRFDGGVIRPGVSTEGFAAPSIHFAITIYTTRFGITVVTTLINHIPNESIDGTLFSLLVQAKVGSRFEPDTE